MPVKKSFTRPIADEPMIPVQATMHEPESEHPMSCCKYGRCDRHSWGGWVGKKLLMTFVGILLVYLIVFLGVLIRNELRKYDNIGMADKPERTIRVEGEGKVSVKPDVAMTTMGVTTEFPTVAEAQQKNTETVNKLVTRLKELGIDSADIQTRDYSVYPSYDYPTNESPKLRGYTISQSVAIKIRNLDKANQVLGLAAEVGATNVNGIQFTVDDKDAYLEAARTEALKKVNEKARALSSMLGLNLASIVSYDEYETSAVDPYYGGKMYYEGGMGGGAMTSVEAGTQDVVLRVGVTFELR